MFSKILDALASFFRSLFGTGENRPPAGQPDNRPDRPAQPQPAPTPAPPPAPTPSEATGDLPPPPSPEVPQDGAEIALDTIVVVASEHERIEPDPQDVPAAPDAGAPAAPTPAPAPAPAPEPGPRGRFMWILDNGHGEDTPGKRSPKLENGERFFEYEFNRDIVARIIKKLEPLGVQVHNLVPEVEGDISLQTRVARANGLETGLPKIFVSVHANAGPARTINDYTQDNTRGIEVWFYHGSKKGRWLANVFQRHLVEFTGFRSRNVKSKPTGQFYVLRHTAMPAILTENGFYNNRLEVAELVKDKVRQQIADAHVAAILEVESQGFFGNLA